MFSGNPIVRRKSRQIMVGDVLVGGDAPISVQSMTNTSTADVAATVAQIERIQQAGADIVRVSVPSLEEAEAFGEIRKKVTIPLVADIHFDHNIALNSASIASRELESCVPFLACTVRSRIRFSMPDTSSSAPSAV